MIENVVEINDITMASPFFTVEHFRDGTLKKYLEFTGKIYKNLGDWVDSALN